VEAGEQQVVITTVKIDELWSPGGDARIETRELLSKKLPAYIKPDTREWLEPGDYLCVVCGKEVRYLVRHHDHFGDVCQEIFSRRKLEYPTEAERTWANWNCSLSDVFSTFEATHICSLCNSICPRIKHSHPYVFPKFTSFSPTEMSDFLNGKPALEIWATKKLSYKPIVDWFASKNPEIKDIFVSEWKDKSKARRIPKEDKPWKIPVDKARAENTRLIQALEDCDLAEMVRVAIDEEWSPESLNYFGHGQWIIHMGAPRHSGDFKHDFEDAVKHNEPEFFSELWEECYASRDFNLVPDYYTQRRVRKSYGF
jgi:hypothetical protein